MVLDPPEPPHFAGRPLRKMSRTEYDKLVELGYLTKEDKVELVFGMVVAMSPIDNDHCESVARIAKRLTIVLGDRASVRTQLPLAASDDSEPEPDICIVPPTGWGKDHPARAYLVVEVARSSLRYDRATKAHLYALSTVDEYWIVDHIHGVVEIYRDRDDGRWRTMTTHGRGETIAPRAFPDATIAVSEIVPPIA